MVSIVVPIYNAAPYLDKCIKSLINQTEEDIEILLINDGSVDNSLHICQDFQKFDSRIRVIDKNNGGVSSARNLGIIESNGEFIMFVDADDYVAPNYVSIMLSRQSKNLNSFIISDICGFKSDNSKVPLHNSCVSSGRYKLKDYYLFSINNLLNQPVNKIYKRKTIVDNHILFDESLQLAEDICFNLDYLEYCEEIVFINKILYYCLIDRESSLCHRYYDNLIDIYSLVHSKHLNLFDRFDIDSSYKQKLDSSLFGMYMDCLEQEMEYNQSFFTKIKKIRRVLKEEKFVRYLNNYCTGVFYNVLKTKNPYLYFFYYRLSKIRRKNGN